ncbi:MAG: hypothetical protein IT447_07090 [Phycisphaerales bacterium]|jgi:hypothetical protein|nr:hypothetical protein [Phycisphaerales bacterium]
MTIPKFIPDSIGTAASELILSLIKPPQTLTGDEFIRAWSSLAYLFPQLHPDGLDDPDGGWPAVLTPLGMEARRRVDAGELDEDGLYPSDAQWCGVYDRMDRHTDEEDARRRSLSGLGADSVND